MFVEVCLGEVDPAIVGNVEVSSDAVGGSPSWFSVKLCTEAPDDSSFDLFELRIFKVRKTPCTMQAKKRSIATARIFCFFSSQLVQYLPLQLPL
jgi:hypothetical protein